MARLRRSRRSLMPSQTSAPLSLEIVGGPIQMAQQANAVVQLARDRQALDNLAAGHTQWFVDFANARMKEATSSDDKAYWQSLLEETHRHIIEDTLAADVKAGNKKLEDVAAYVQSRMSTAGSSSPEYPSLLQQYTDVKNAIAARDFNAKIYEAQQHLVETNDREAYVSSLETLMAKLTDPILRQALGDQVQTVQKMLADQAQNARYAEVSTNLVKYLDGKISRVSMMDQLTEFASTATTPEEANRYVTLATQIDTRERTLERQAASDAASSGTVALQAALDPAKHAYEDADAAFKVAFRTGNADRGVYSTFKKEADHYLATLHDALPNAANRSVREQIINATQSIIANVGERDKQMSELITRDVSAEVDDLNSKADRAAAMKTPAGDDMAAQLRYLAVQSLQGALADPVIKAQGPADSSVRALSKALRETSERHQVSIDAQAAVVAGSDGPAPLRTANRAAYNAYRDFAVSRPKAGTADATDLITRGTPLEYNQFLDAVDQAAGDSAKLAGLLGLGVDAANKNKKLVPQAQTELENLIIRWTNNIGQGRSEQQDIVNAANDRLKMLVAPRDPVTGQRIRTKDVMPPRGQLQQPANETVAVPRTDAASLMAAAHGAGGARDPFAGETALPAQPAAPPPPVAPPAQFAPQLAQHHDPTTEGVTDPYTRSEIAAFKFLDTPSYAVDLPNFDIPPLPETPPFTDNSVLSLFDMPNAPLAQRRGTGGVTNPSESIAGPLIAA